MTMLSRHGCSIRRSAVGLALGCLLPCSVSTPLAAQERRRELLQEVLIGESAVPQARGEWQFTMANRGTMRSPSRLLRSSIDIEYGLSDSWELDVGAAAFAGGGLERGAAARALSDARVGVRRFWRLLDEQRLVFAAGIEGGYQSSVTPASGSELAVEPALAVAYDTPALGGAQLFAGIASERPVARLREAPTETAEGSEFGWNAGLVAAAGRARVILEAISTSGTAPVGVRDRFALVPGVALPFGDGWEMALGTVFGMRGRHPVDLILKLTYEP